MVCSAVVSRRENFETETTNIVYIFQKDQSSQLFPSFGKCPYILVPVSLSVNYVCESKRK